MKTNKKTEKSFLFKIIKYNKQYIQRLMLNLMNKFKIYNFKI